MVLLIEPGGLPFVPSGWVGPGSVLMVVVGLFVGGWCEEIGYRGVMYRAMAERCHPWLCVIVNGAFFGVCHLQYFDLGLLYVTLFVGCAIGLDVIMASVWVGSWRNRVLAASVVHGVANVVLQAVGVEYVVETCLMWFLATALSAVMAYIIGVKMGVGDFAAARQTKIGVKSE
ncbi:CPBP family intramembrane glutamic endopeptidase [Actinomyces sp. oral taxon 171]|jgi:abortive infection protein|uniref:CPBP family intramembrane glutamic endopeptidase n=1 Tax=Actinomyces sp. oral taxon 171 TaxID=706438 RepID=UPI000556DAE4|nr:CPBP family intramembrane glutamic endopeptidase [Actinomyces sp. oral taxon 171]